MATQSEISERRSRKASLARAFEERARRIVETIQSRSWDLSPESMVAREIGLTVTRIDRVRSLREEQLKSLLQTECYVDTELMQMEQRTPRYSPSRYPEREKLQRRLLALEVERRKLLAQEADRVQPLEERLLSLLEKHAQLQP